MRVTTGMWTNNITLFLFDHQLVYCKKDILKRNTYVYKGRIYLDTSEVIDVPDGKGTEYEIGQSLRDINRDTDKHILVHVAQTIKANIIMEGAFINRRR